jgi:hypothetical protein
MVNRVETGKYRGEFARLTIGLEFDLRLKALCFHGISYPKSTLH